MSYIVLARRWRPQCFKEVVGQSHVTKILQNALLTGRIPHAYIFAGPRGVGKTSVARILAKALNCNERKESSEPCNRCSSCQSITEAKSPDVIEIDGASNRGIDNIRALQETVAYKPIAGKYKIYIIDEVHMLTTEAFNALLKTLEEPPSHVRFVFATTEPHKIPSTVVSRCQRFDFRRIPAGEIKDHLTRICSHEGYSVPADVIEVIASEADGSMRDAETLLEQVISFQDENIRPDEILNLLGLIDQSTLIRAMDAVISSNLEECLAVASDIYERGLDCAKFCQRLLDICHRLVCFMIAPDKIGTAKDGMSPILQRWASETSIQTVQIYYDLLIRATDQIRRSSQPHLVLEALLLRLSQVPHLMMIPQVIKNLEAHKPVSAGLPDAAINRANLFPEKKLDQEKKEEKVYEFTAGTVTYINGGSSTELAPETKYEDPKEHWHKFISWASQQDSLLQTQLKESYVDASKEGLWTIHVLSAYVEVLKRKQDVIFDLIKRFFSPAPQKIVIQPYDGNNNVNRTKANSNHRKEIEQIALNHPLVKEVLEIFGGHVADIKPLRKPSQKYNLVNPEKTKEDPVITGGVDEDL